LRNSTVLFFYQAANEKSKCNREYKQYRPSFPTSERNSGASAMCLWLASSHFSSSSSFFSSYSLRFIRYIAANTPIIANKKLKPGIGVVVGLGEAI